MAREKGRALSIVRMIGRSQWVTDALSPFSPPVRSSVALSLWAGEDKRLDDVSMGGGGGGCSSNVLIYLLALRVTPLLCYAFVSQTVNRVVLVTTGPYLQRVTSSNFTSPLERC